ncbi:MAG: DUF2752 domain-containing protein [Eubacterium sp.]
MRTCALALSSNVGPGLRNRRKLMQPLIKHITNKQHTADDILFLLGCLLLLPLISLTFFYNLGWIHPTRWLPPCLFHLVTGLPCPGCGGTRAFVALLHGDILHSFLCHPVVPYCFFLYVIFMITQTAARFFNWHTKRKSVKSNNQIYKLSFHVKYVYLAVIIILVQWIIKILAAIF